MNDDESLPEQSIKMVNSVRYGETIIIDYQPEENTSRHIRTKHSQKSLSILANAYHIKWKPHKNYNKTTQCYAAPILHSLQEQG